MAVLVSGSVAGCGGALEPAGLTNATAGSLLVLFPETAITNKTLLALDLNLLGPVAVLIKIAKIINRKVCVNYRYLNILYVHIIVQNISIIY